MRTWTILAAVVVLTAFAHARGQWDAPLDGPLGDAGGTVRMTARLVPEYVRIVPGQRFHVAVGLQIADGWGYYSPTPGDAQGVTPQPAEISVSADGLQVHRALWPPDEPYGDGTQVYKDRAVLYVPLTVPPDAESGPRTVRVTMGGQVCKEVCILLRGPHAVTPEAEVEVAETVSANPDWADDPRIVGGLATARPVGGEAPAAADEPDDGAEPAEENAAALGPLPKVAPPDYALGVALAGAVLAGLILNVMPCVLPIIPLRIYTLVNLAGQRRRRFVTLGLAFAAGIVLFFVGVAVANGVLKLAAGRALNWSEHWQFPLVRAGLGLLVVALAANLLGAFDIIVPSGIASAEGSAQRRGHAGATGMGLMMAILATPCSAAFVIGILGWAQGQALWLGTVAILLMGVGMAAPHALLTAFPKLLDKLPRPGRWMEILKQSMGFILLPLALWLLWTLRTVPRGYGLWVSVYAALLAIGLWIAGRWVRPDGPALRKWGVRLAVAGVLVAAGYWMLAPPAQDASSTTVQPTRQAGSGDDGGAATAGRIAAARDAGKAVVVKFTADWCLECAVVDRRVYQDAEVKARLASDDVVYLVGDVTNRGAPASDLLERIGGAPPLTAVFPPAGDPIYLPGGIAKQDLLDALRAAGNDE
ncbi:MAG: cytochrome c biogenesis protein CcdA [Planctomycetota bacterium]